MKELIGLAKALDHRAHVDDIRWANAAKRRAFWGGAIRLDDALKDDNGDQRESACLGDGGCAAALIRLAGEEAPEPDWPSVLSDCLKGIAAGSRLQAFYFALLQDLRPAVAARLVGISRMQAYRYLAQLRELLAPAHEAWRRLH